MVSSFSVPLKSNVKNMNMHTIYEGVYIHVVIEFVIELNVRHIELSMRSAIVTVIANEIITLAQQSIPHEVYYHATTMPLPELVAIYTDKN